MTESPCRVHGLGGGVTSSGGTDRPLIRGMTTGVFPRREALRNVDVAISAVAGPDEYDRRTQHVIDTGDINIYLGLDVGKGEHHATALTPAGKKTFDRRLPNSEPKLREVFAKLQAKHGTVLVIVDQVASIGALPLAVARELGCHVAYLPGLTMRRIADLYPGEAKTDWEHHRVRGVLRLVGPKDRSAPCLVSDASASRSTPLRGAGRVRCGLIGA
jgi:hypothetical protein